MGKKKEKTVYVDDGRTLADMSGVPGSRLSNRSSGSSFKDKWNTYWSAVKMMFLPMLATIGAICVLFGILSLIFYLMYV